MSGNKKKRKIEKQKLRCILIITVPSFLFIPFSLLSKVKSKSLYKHQSHIK